MANERRNERVRLMGNWCNAGSIAIITLGALAPTFAGVYQWFKMSEPTEPLIANWQIPAVALAIGFAVHGLGQVILQGIVDQEVSHGDE